MSFDSRGSAVWEWAMKTGIFKRDIDTKRLEALAEKHLEIDSRKASSGADPYNNTRSAHERVLTQLTGKPRPKDSRSQAQPSRWWPFTRRSS